MADPWLCLTVSYSLSIIRAGSAFIWIPGDFLDTKQQSARLFGERLRREREMRGVSLDEIAESTKIGTRLLKALEDEQFDLLPGGIFNKGFVRAYAKYLGMDEEQAVADYLQVSGDGETDVQLLAQQTDKIEPRYSDLPSSSGRGFPFAPVVVLLVVVVAGFGGWKLYQQQIQKRAARRAEQEASAATLSPGAATQVTPGPGTPDDTSATTYNAQPSSDAPAAKPTVPAAAPSSEPLGNSTAPVPSSGFEVALKTTGRAWVSLKADGKILVRGVLDAGQVKTLRADHEIVVWTGNAGATEVSFNGKPVPLAGGVNEAKVLVFNPDGLQPNAPPAAQSPAQSTAEPSPSRQ
jgi:cytoskeleton protein RodZ